MVMAEPRGTGMALCAGTLRVGAKNGKKEANQKAPDRRQPALLLPLTGARKRNQRPSADPAVISALSQTDGACSGDCDRPFRPKVITDSGDRDHAAMRPIGSA